MKVFASVIILFLIAGCAHFSGNSSDVNIDGTWKGEMNSGGGGMPMYFTFNFKKTGDYIKGTVNGTPGQWIPLENIELKGKKITFSVTTDIGGMKMNIDYKGAIKGDKIKMSFKTQTPSMSGGPGFGMSSGPGMRSTDLGMAGRGGGFGGGSTLGMHGGPAPENKFTIERVSNILQGPVE
jgi:hypothetical protein